MSLCRKNHDSNGAEKLNSIYDIIHLCKMIHPPGIPPEIPPGCLEAFTSSKDVAVDSWYMEFMEWATEPNQAMECHGRCGQWTHPSHFLG
jgi:hypothetical protein